MAPSTEAGERDAPALRLAELLCGRLCHDLSSLLGSLEGTLELAAAEPETAAEALPLAGETAATLTRRLRLLRTIWGEDGDPIDLPTLQRLAGDLPGAHRATLDFSGLAAAGPVAAAPARVLLNMLLLALESLPRGGRVTVRDAAPAGYAVAIEGARAAWPQGLTDALAAEDLPWEALGGPRQLQAPLTVLIARRAGLRLVLDGGLLVLHGAR